VVTSCLIGGQDFLQQVKCGWCARWLLAVLDLVAALRWAFLVPQVSLVIDSSLLLSISRLVPVRYENGPSNYVKVIRIIVKKTILEILLGLAVLGLCGAGGRAVVVDTG